MIRIELPCGDIYYTEKPMQLQYLSKQGVKESLEMIMYIKNKSIENTTL